MPDDKDFQVKIQRISELVGELERIPEAEARTSAKALVQLLLDLHATGLERVLEIVADSGETGQRTIDDLGRDSLVSSLLVLYGLHPLGLEERVARAVDKVIPQVRKAGGALELLGVESGMLRLHLTLTGHSCGSTGKTLQKLVEDAMYEAAPDMQGLSMTGLDEVPASGFVPLEKLGGIIAAAPVMNGAS